jgi:signal transduction histidine kinase
MFDIYQSSILIAALFFTGFGGFAVWKDHRDQQTRLFALMTLAFAIWIYSWFGLLRIGVDNSDTALLFARLLNFGAIFIPVLFLHWVLTIVGQARLKEGKMLLWICYAITAYFATFSFSDLYVSGTRSTPIFQYWPVAGPLYPYFVAIGYIGFVVIGLVILAINISKASGEPKIRMIYLLVGAILGFGGGITNFPLMFGYDLPEFCILIGVFMLMACPLVLSYAALHYRLFNIRNVSVQLFAGAFDVIFIINILRAQTFSDAIVNLLILLFALWFTYLLLRTLYREVEQREALTIANASQENLIHIMNHQIKGFIGKNRNIFAELMSGDYGTAPEPFIPLLKEGFEQSTNGVNYVQSILRGASAATGKLPFSMVPMDLKQIALNEISQEKSIAEKKGLTYESSVEDGDYNIVGDPVQIAEAFKNLITNAIKYNSPDGHIWINLKHSDEKVTFSVKDSGVGVSDKDKTKLFTAGGMGENSRRINVEAAGYGLSFVKGVAIAHGGIAGYKSNGPEKGSTFFIELPVRS